jgi:hypothetical protein
LLTMSRPPDVLRNFYVIAIHRDNAKQDPPPEPPHPSVQPKRVSELTHVFNVWEKLLTKCQDQYPPDDASNRDAHEIVALITNSPPQCTWPEPEHLIKAKEEENANSESGLSQTRARALQSRVPDELSVLASLLLDSA